MDYYKDLHELCETLSEEIADANEKIRSGGGKISAGDLEYIDKLTHALKSIKTTMAMMESEGSYDGMYDGGASGRYMNGRQGSYNRGSYARGRDRMGRYISRDGDFASQVRELMEQAPDDRTRMELQKVVDKMERM